MKTIDRSRVSQLSLTLRVWESHNKDGLLTTALGESVAASVALNIAPPAVEEGKYPYRDSDIDDDELEQYPAGTWIHYMYGLARLISEGDDVVLRLKEGQKSQDRNVVRSATNRMHYVHRLTSKIYYALRDALKHEQAIVAQLERENEAEARAAKEAERVAAEAALSEEARAAIQATRDAEAAAKARLQQVRKNMFAAATQNVVAPPVLAPRPVRKDGPKGERVVEHPPLNVDRVRKLLDSAAKRNIEQKQMSASQARLSGTKWVMEVIARDASRCSPNDLALFEREVRTDVYAAFFSESQNDSDATTETKAFIEREKAFIERKLKSAARPAPKTAVKTESKEVAPPADKPTTAAPAPQPTMSRKKARKAEAERRRQLAEGVQA